MAVLTQSSAPQVPFLDRIQVRIDDVRARLAQYRVFRQTLNELGALSNRELADLGLHRSQVRRLAYEAAYEAR